MMTERLSDLAKRCDNQNAERRANLYSGRFNRDKRDTGDRDSPKPKAQSPKEGCLLESGIKLFPSLSSPSSLLERVNISFCLSMICILSFEL